MAKKNFYVIKNGVDPKTGLSVINLVLKTWAEAEPYIKGVRGAIYAGFATYPEVEKYIGSEDPLKNVSEGGLPDDYIHCYVDGSHSSEINNYGCGIVCVKDDKAVYADYKRGSNTEAISMQQIGGELLGAMTALTWAKKSDYKKVAIIHDYMGTCYHAVGYWDRDNSFSVKYYDWMQNFFKENPSINVKFFKIDAHKGFCWNEIADGLAKLSVDIRPDSKFFSLIKEKGIILPAK